MEFTLTTKKGTQIVIDTQLVEEVVVEIDGVKYKINIKKIN